VISLVGNSLKSEVGIISRHPTTTFIVVLHLVSAGIMFEALHAIAKACVENEYPELRATTRRFEGRYSEEVHHIDNPIR